MTPIKAEALLALAQELRCARAETSELNGKIRMPIELIVHCEAVLSKLAAAPVGNDGVIPVACNGCANIGWCHATNKCTIAGKPLVLPQPQEALADEIKRADVAPPEASFDNASDMLGYLNAPREAEETLIEMSKRSRNATIEECARIADRWGDGEATMAAAEIRMLKATASPSPIPEAPGGRDEIARIIRENIEIDMAWEGESIRNPYAVADLIVRALKPQDGGETKCP